MNYSDIDCGGPFACSGCCSFRHGVYEDGSGDPEALRIAAARVRLSAAQSRVLGQLAESPLLAYSRSRSGRLQHGGASIPILARAGLIVAREPRGTGWLVTDLGRATLRNIGGAA